VEIKRRIVQNHFRSFGPILRTRSQRQRARLLDEGRGSQRIRHDRRSIKEKLNMAKEVLDCSFCGRKKPETSLLIAGISAHICDKCIEQAHGIVLEELKAIGNAKLAADLVLRKPKEIRAFLDQY